MDHPMIPQPSSHVILSYVLHFRKPRYQQAASKCMRPFLSWINKGGREELHTMSEPGFIVKQELINYLSFRLVSDLLILASLDTIKHNTRLRYHVKFSLSWFVYLVL